MRRATKIRSGCADGAKWFWRDRRGMSAVEFCLVVPLLILLAFGCAAVMQGVILQRKVTLIASTVANLVAQNASVSSTDMSNFFGASSLIVAPYPTSPVKIVLTCVSIDGSGNATVSWSKTSNGTARSTGSAVTLPAAINVKNTSLIMSEVTYLYRPGFATTVIGSVNLSKTAYMSPRQSSTVTYSS
jgi:Flp pilus assembly protein TadG